MRQGKRILSVAVVLFLLMGLLGIPAVTKGDEPEGYQICYHGNYESAPAEQTADLPTEEYITIPDAVTLGYEREGYQFVKWTSAEDGSGDPVFSGEIWSSNLIDLADDQNIVHLYAQWDPYYVVAYQANNGQSEPAMYKGPFYKGDQFQIAGIEDTGFTNPGYRFTGWKDGKGNSYTPGDVVSDLTDKPGEVKVVSLYAQWKTMEQSYEVVYDPNGDDGHSQVTVGPYEIGEDEGSAEHFRVANASDKALAFEKAGYVFQCWNTKADGSGVDFKPGQDVWNLAGNGETVYLYAQWTPLFYLASYEANNGDGSIDPVTMGPYLMDKEIRIAGIEDTGFTNTGYVFTGWNTKADGTGTPYEPGKSYQALTTTPGKVVQLYAQWQAIENGYLVTYHPNFGDGSILPVTKGPFEITEDGSSAGVFAIEENIYYNPGKVFVCWNTKADGTGKNYSEGEMVSNLTKQAGSTVDLYAQWGEESYLVAYYPNVGNPSLPAALTGPHNLGSKFQLLTAQKAGFARTGYQFTGWNTKPDGTGKAYAAGQTVSNLTENPRTIVPLYAQWKAKKANPMTVTPKSKTFKAKNLKKSAKKFTITVKNRKGTVTFTPNKAAKKAKITVTAKGKVTVPQKCKRGTYVITVKAAGTDAYKPGTATVKIVVK